MPDNNEDDVSIKFGLILDKESFKEATKTGDNLISLIADLAIIGKVAANALGSMWSGMQKTINTGLKQFDDINLGLTVGVNPEDLARLQHAVGQIGGDSKDVNSMLKSLDAKRLSFTDTQTGEKELVDLITEMATFGVSEGEGEALKDALKEGDLIEAIKLFGDLRNELGENFSNFADRLGLSGLKELELGHQYEDWLKAWADSSVLITDVNIEGLNDLENGYATMATALREASKELGGIMGPFVDDLGDAMMEGTKNLISWFDEFREKPIVKEVGNALKEDLLDVISGDKLLLEVMTDRIISIGKTVGDKVNTSFESGQFGTPYDNTNQREDYELWKQSSGAIDKGTQITVETMNVTTEDIDSFIKYDLNGEISGL